MISARSKRLNDYAVIWLRRINVRLDRSEQERIYRDWSAVLNAASNLGAEELRVKSSSDEGQPAGAAPFYGHYEYRRPTPLSQFVPWLPLLIAL